MKKKFNILLTVFVVIMIMLSVVSTQAITEDNANDFDNVISNNVISDYHEPDLSNELEELRDENTKAYLQPNGSIVYRIHSYKIHYKESNGKYQDIENQLIVSSKEEYEYQNKANSWHVYFSNLDELNQKMIRFENNEQYVCLSLIAGGKGGQLRKAIKNTLSDVEKKYVKDVNSTVVYNGFGEDYSITYTVMEDKVKENIILNTPLKGAVRFLFTLKLSSGLEPCIVDEGISIEDSTGSRTLLIQKPYMEDAAGNISDDISMSIKRTENFYTMELKPSLGFLNNAVFPVVIDPDYRIQDSTAKGTFISDLNKYTNYNTGSQASYLRVGNWSGYGECYTLLQFVKPTSWAFNNSSITSAVLKLRRYAPSTLPNENETYAHGYSLRVSPLNAPFNSSTVTYNTRPATGAAYVPFFPLPTIEDKWHVVTVTDDAQNGTLFNTGIQLYSPTDSYSSLGPFVFYSEDYLTQSYRPILDVCTTPYSSKTVNIKIVTDTTYRTAAKYRELVNLAGSRFSAYGLTLTAPSNAYPWSSPNTTDPQVLLNNLRTIDFGTNQLLIGLTDINIVGFIGLAETYGGNFLVLREQGLPESTMVRYIQHELSHLYGAEDHDRHSLNPTCVMSYTYDAYDENITGIQSVDYWCTECLHQMMSNRMRH